MIEDGVELLQFPYSHFNEKARWALDWKRVPHRRRDLLPGPHALTIKRLTGQAQVPVVRFGATVVAGSARIIDELERRVPAPPLYPADPTLRARALELQAWLDADVGPMVRRGLFAVLLQTSGYLSHVFSSSRRAPTRALYRASFPLVKGLMRTSMGITDQASIEQAHTVTRQALDLVAETSHATGQLVGDGFTVADLTAAALLAPAAAPPAPSIALPEPRPQLLRDWYARWAAHPGTAWVRAQYARHRAGADDRLRDAS